MRINYSKTNLLLLVIFAAMASCNPPGNEESSDSKSSDGFNGKIALDVRDSKPDWEAYTPKRAPEDAPNILFVL